MAGEMMVIKVGKAPEVVVEEHLPLEQLFYLVLVVKALEEMVKMVGGADLLHMADKAAWFPATVVFMEVSMELLPEEGVVVPATPEVLSPEEGEPTAKSL
jgi:hypothetical protein